MNNYLACIRTSTAGSWAALVGSYCRTAAFLGPEKEKKVIELHLQIFDTVRVTGCVSFPVCGENRVATVKEYYVVQSQHNLETNEILT